MKQEEIGAFLSRNNWPIMLKFLEPVKLRPGKITQPEWFWKKICKEKLTAQLNNASKWYILFWKPYIFDNYKIDLCEKMNKL